MPPTPQKSLLTRLILPQETLIRQMKILMHLVSFPWGMVPHISFIKLMFISYIRQVTPRPYQGADQGYEIKVR